LGLEPALPRFGVIWDSNPHSLGLESFGTQTRSP